MLMELELGLALPNQTPVDIKRHIKQKRESAEAFDNGEIENKKLCLLLWSGQPNEEEDDRRGSQRTDNKRINEEENIIVGWPPINSMRKELLHHHHQQYHGGNWIARFPGRDNNNGARNRMSLLVKVKMEGVAIGRKIDLRLFNSYQALKHTLLHMFSKYLKIDRNGTEYTVLYQDKEGDWLLAGDVPWETFMESVQRMEILRNDS
ncbi:Auxin-responsive protein IAA29 [Forsythia ovata]|uniref:Auxin-responsive protein n=1 Tax=Forsythia ovata TaxID=205694 RepID=A0ABD1WGU7_9LAMI